MEELVFSNALRILADGYALRYVERSHHYLGICEGLCLDFSTSAEGVHLYFLSPSVEIADHQLNHFQGFSNLKEAGIPPEWLRGNTFMTGSGSHTLDKHGCTLTLDLERLGLLNEEQFLSIPKVMASDFQALGAPARLPACSVCGKEGPDQLFYYGNVYQYACSGCLKDLQDHAPDGQVIDATPVNWPLAGGVLVLGSVVFSGAWGLLQQVDRITDKALLIAPFLGAMLFAKLIARLAGGVSLLLRVLTLVATVSSVFAGNIWGLRASILKQGFECSWTQVIEYYFTQYLANSQTEGWYLLGGLGGAWFGSRMLNSPLNFALFPVRGLRRPRHPKIDHRKPTKYFATHI